MPQLRHETLIEVRKEVRSVLWVVTGKKKVSLGVGGDRYFTTSGRKSSFKLDSQLKLFFHVSADGDVELLQPRFREIKCWLARAC